jgi:hypothetical protein
MYEVELAASAYSPGSVSLAQSLADPLFQIDAGFLADNPGYSLEFSPGVENAELSSVPLPAALPLLGSAVLGLAGFGARKSRRQQSRG